MKNIFGRFQNVKAKGKCENDKVNYVTTVRKHFISLLPK